MKRRRWTHFLPKGCVRPFRGREVDPKRRVRVYRNLQNKSYSIVQDGFVVAHACALMLVDVNFVVSEAGWRRSRRLGKKTVHAFAEGLLTDSGMGRTPVESDMRRLRYDIGIGAFVHDITVLPVKQRTVRGARVVAFNERGMSGSYWY